MTSISIIHRYRSFKNLKDVTRASTIGDQPIGFDPLSDASADVDVCWIPGIQEPKGYYKW